MAALSAWIESLSLEISANDKCQEYKIDFDFSHVECIDNYLFLWNDNYSHKILRIHLETKEIQPILIKQNIKIDSLKVISRNNNQLLLISENKLKSQIHFINIKNPKQLQQFSYQMFSSPIIQIEYSSISSNTVYVLTNDNFNIIGLNDECNEIIYHDRIHILGKNIVNFCLGTPKHLHDKLFNEYKFYYGFSKFAAYFIDQFGSIYVCAPIIPHRFQCTLQVLDTLSFENDELYDVWLNQTWNISMNNNMNESILSKETKAAQQPYTSHNTKAPFVYDNKTIYRGVYKLNIHQTETIKHHAFCTKILMLDLDSFFFNESRLKKSDIIQTYDDYIKNDDEDEMPTNILPIFIRIWSDHSIDIVCCSNPIHASFEFNDYETMVKDTEDYDGIVISRNYLEFNDDNENNECFIISKCIQNLDEVIIGHTLQGIYRLKMKWLHKVPFALSKGDDEYFKLLQESISNIEQIPLYKFYMNSRQKAYNAILSDLCIAKNIQTNDELIILDEHLKQIHAFPLYNIDINKSLNDDDEKQTKQVIQIDIDTKFDLNIMKPYKNDEIEAIRDSLSHLVFDIKQFPADFSLTNPDSLKWFVENIKIKMEKEVFDKLELGHLLMNERKSFIENQINQYIVPQILLIGDKIKQINANNMKLKRKIKEIMDNHQMLKNKIKNIGLKMKEYENFYNNDKNDIIRFKNILRDYSNEVDALEYDYDLLNQYKKEQCKMNNIEWTKQDMLHLNGKIKNKIKNSDKMLRQMVNGLQQI